VSPASEDGRRLRVSQFQGGARQWDEFVRSQRGWTHFHLYDWKRVIENVFGHECLYLGACDDGGRLNGALPLVRVRSRVFGHYLVSMPFLNYGGPLGTSAAVRRLTDHATQLALESGAGLLELRSTVELDVPLPVSHRKITMLLDLPQNDPAQLWDGFKAKLRSQIRRPQKEGVTLRIGLEQLDGFFHVFSRHMRDLGTPTQPRRLFQEIADAFPESVWFGCAYLADEVVAAGCGFQWNGEFEMTWDTTGSRPTCCSIGASWNRRYSRGSARSTLDAARPAAERIGSNGSGARATFRCGGTNTTVMERLPPRRLTTPVTRGARGSGSTCPCGSRMPPVL
jgi:FemAB-related protein (PEP-CTERM system-associated)